MQKKHIELRSSGRTIAVGDNPRICSAQRHDNRRAAGAVCIIRNQCLVLSLDTQDIVGPAARQFGVFRGS